ncbi:MAG: DNA methyltransferase [Calditrichota bacterium]
MNRLFYGDCLDVLKNSIEDESIDLIYIDPPFNSKRNYNVLFEAIDMSDVKAQKEAFADTWSNVKYLDQLALIQDLRLDLFKFLNTLDRINVSKSVVSYLTTMAYRILYMHCKLKSTGSFYLHCDPTMSHYLKIVCDLIFSKSNFRNEIIWCYRGGGSSRREFRRKHDVILRYSKSSHFVFFPDSIRVPYQAEGIQRKDDSMWGKHKGTNKIYKPHPLGKIPEDWWLIDALDSNDPERLHFPTQKPEALLERIISASSNEGDLVADFFCGCGTAVAVAQRINRRWIGVDISHLAVRLILNRVMEPYRNDNGKYVEIKNSIEVTGFPRDIASAHELATGTKKGRIKFQDWVIEVLMDGVSNPKKVGDGGYDGYLTLYRDAKTRDVLLIEVKSGNVNVGDLRKFIYVVDHEKAAMGVWVCFADQVTRGMSAIAQQAGYYDQEAFGSRYPRIQIITVEELLEGKTVAHPNPAVFNVTFKRAGRK